MMNVEKKEVLENIESSEYKIYTIHCQGMNTIEFKNIRQHPLSDIKQIIIGQNYIHSYWGDFLHYHQQFISRHYDRDSYYLPDSWVPKLKRPLIAINIETRGVLDIAIGNSVAEKDRSARISSDTTLLDLDVVSYRYIQNNCRYIKYLDPQLITKSQYSYFWCKLPLGTQLINEMGQALEPHQKDDYYVYFYYQQRVDWHHDIYHNDRYQPTPKFNIWGKDVIYSIIWPDQPGMNSTLLFPVQEGRTNICRTDNYLIIPYFC
jgi:hypothetical protein